MSEETTVIKPAIKIRMNEGKVSCGPNETLSAGNTYIVDNDHGAALIKSGSAIEVPMSDPAPVANHRPPHWTAKTK